MPFVSFNFRVNVRRYPATNLLTASNTLSYTRRFACALLAEGGPEVKGVCPVYSEWRAKVRL